MALILSLRVARRLYSSSFSTNVNVQSFHLHSKCNTKGTFICEDATSEGKKVTHILLVFTTLCQMYANMTVCQFTPSTDKHMTLDWPSRCQHPQQSLTRADWRALSPPRRSSNHRTGPRSDKYFFHFTIHFRSCLSTFAAARLGGTERVAVNGRGGKYTNGVG